MSKSMPVCMQTAVISTIPKPGKDHMQMNNLKPLSLLSNEYM